MARELNSDQIFALQRVVRSGNDGAEILNETSELLQARGLVRETTKLYWTEWNNRNVGRKASLSVCVATDAGRAAVSDLAT
jgi:hypothetical protein